jgi:hypothetical protein
MPTEIPGDLCPYKKYDRRVRIARQMADAHNGSWLLRGTFYCWVQVFRNWKQFNARPSQKLWLKFKETVVLPPQFWDPPDGEKAAILKGSQPARQALMGLCLRLLCYKCVMHTNQNLEGEVVKCSYCMNIGRGHKEHAVWEKAKKQAESAEYKKQRAQREEALHKPPGVTTMLTDCSERNLYIGSEWERGLRLLPKPPYDQVSKKYSTTELEAQLLVRPNPMYGVSMDTNPWELVADASRPYDLPFFEFAHVYGQAAADMAVCPVEGSYDVLGVSGMFVLRGYKYDQAPQGSSEEDPDSNSEAANSYQNFSGEERDDNSQDVSDGVDSD